MEPWSNLLYLLEPASLALIATAVAVVLMSAHRALTHEKESERRRDLSDSSVTLDGTHALLVPLASSASLLLMFYLFAAVSQLVTAFTAVAAASSVAFALSPIAAQVTAALGIVDHPVVVARRGPGGGGGSSALLWCGCCCSGGASGGNQLSRSQLALGAASTALVVAWLLSGHWLLNNVLGIAICIAFVSHVRLPNIKVCTLLLACLFVYDIFWVFFSERFFGANVMVSVATQQAQNPVHTVAHSLHLPVPHSVSQKLDLPVKLLFPRNLLRSLTDSSAAVDFMMLGLGDMAIPGMLLALVLCFEHRKGREYDDAISVIIDSESDKSSSSISGGNTNNNNGISSSSSMSSTSGSSSESSKGTTVPTCRSSNSLTQSSSTSSSRTPLLPSHHSSSSSSQLLQPRVGYCYVWYAAAGYTIGLTAALAAGVLTRSPQPALLYLVPCTLGPVAALAWARRELSELWNGHEDGSLSLPGMSCHCCPSSSSSCCSSSSSKHCLHHASAVVRNDKDKVTV